MQHLKILPPETPKPLSSISLRKKLALSGYIQKTVKTGMTN
ncbi:hypothetical protein [Escherichia coli]